MKTLLPEDFQITDAMRSWADNRVPTVDIDRETENFADYWRARGTKMADWTACWRTWMRRAPTMKGSALRSIDETRVRALMADYTARGFRRAFVHETASMYQTAFEASQQRALPQRPTLELVGSLARSKKMPK